MKIRIFALGSLFVLVSSFAMAQTEFPKVEIGTTYQYIRTSSTGFVQPFNMNGGAGSLTVNFSKMLGITGEFGAAYAGSIQNFNASGHIFSYLFGPKFSHRASRAPIYGTALFGGAWANASFLGLVGRVPVAVTGSNNSFALSLGGGVDLNAGQHIAIRVGEFDYFMTRFNPGNQSPTQNNFRYQAGLVFKF
jgi:opacity protein-like surface antigen